MNATAPRFKPVTYPLALSPGSTLRSSSLYSLHAHARNEASQVHSAICSTKKRKMICQPTKGFPDARVSSSVILVYSVTIRWLHFVHAQSICTRPLDQKEVWPGDAATYPYYSSSCYHLHYLPACQDTMYSRTSLAL